MKLYRLILILTISIIQTYIATELIENPDLPNYSELLNLCGIDSACPVEPSFWVISSIAKFIFRSDALFGLYFIHIYLIYNFLYYGIYKKTKNNLKSTIFILAWSLTFGVMHGLIQIRFGLACSILFFTFNLIKSSTLKISSLAIIGVLNHFSMIAFSLLTIAINKLKSINIYSILLIHSILVCCLLLLSNYFFINLLPSALSSRVISYITSDSTEKISIATTIISTLIYLSLIIFHSSSNPTRTLLAIGFLPYIITPNIEILIRLIVPAQYLLLSKIFYEKNNSKKEIITQSLLFIFFIYKIYSGISAFESYLQ